MINLECGHRCRADPVEAITYSLQADGEELKKFKANAAAELTIDVEEQDIEKEKRYDMEVPLNVLREDIAGVSSYLDRN